MNHEQTVFNGRNIVPGMPDNLVRAVSFLSEKEKEGSFVYSTSVSDWAAVEDLLEGAVEPRYESHLIAYAIGIAFIVSQTGGQIVFPERINEWSWASALSVVAPISGWDASCMIRVVSSFHTNKDGIEYVLENAIRVYCRAYFDNGLALLDGLPSFKEGVVAGLLEGDYERFCPLYPPAENQDLFTRAFVHTAQMPQESICKLYDASKAFSPFDSKDAMAFLLTALGDVDDVRKADCRQRILALLQNDTTPYVSPVCNWAIRQVSPDSFYEECILALIKGLNESGRESSLKTIDHAIVLRDKDTEFLERVFLCVAENHTPADIISLECCLHTLSEDKKAFLDFVLFFVLHPKGHYRITGRRLWDNYHMESSSFDPTSLSEELQCVFIVLMLQDYGNPETRLPKIIPLFKSKSEMVNNTLIAYIRPYADEFMGHVTSAIDQAGIDTEWTRRLKKYIEDRHISLEKRRGLKELSPKYAQYKYYQEALRTQSAHLKQQIDKTEKEHPSSITDLFKKQALARGGGLRKDDGTTQHLIPFQVSYPMRILEQSMTPLETMKWIDEITKDYDSTTGDS